MRALDRLLQYWRIRKANPYVHPGERLLDIGCFDGAFIDAVAARVASAVGIDPLAQPGERGNITIHRDTIPGDVRLESASFDCVTVLATLEHLGDPRGLSAECFRVLKPGGRLVLTVPHALVDYVMQALVWLGASDPADLEGHHGFDVNTTEHLFTQAGFRMVRKQRFELGLNRLYVFEKPRVDAV